MKLKRLGKTNVKIPVLGIGTWKMNVHPEQEVEAIQTAINYGMRFVDTAEMYGTEHIVAAALKNQKDVFVATKVSPQHFNHDDVIRACDASLKRLGIKQIDLYQLHWPNPAIDIKETMRAMEELVKQGKIRYIGVSNFSVNEFKAAQDALKSNEIVSNQVEYSILVREVEEELLDFCKHEKVTLIAYSPLVRGALYSRRYTDLLQLLTEIGKKYKKSATQVALNYLISMEPVVAIPKASTKEHVREIAGAGDFELSDADMAQLTHFLEGLEGGA